MILAKIIVFMLVGQNFTIFPSQTITKIKHRVRATDYLCTQRWTEQVLNSINRVVNFGHPALISSFTKYKFLLVKNSFATSVNERSVWNCFGFRIIIFVACIQHLRSAETENDTFRAGCPKLGYTTLAKTYWVDCLSRSGSSSIVHFVHTIILFIILY